MDNIFTGETCIPSKGIGFNIKLLKPYKGHVCAIIWPCVCHIMAMFGPVRAIF